MGVFIREYCSLLVKRRPRVASGGTVVLGRACNLRMVVEDGALTPS